MRTTFLDGDRLLRANRRAGSAAFATEGTDFVSAYGNDCVTGRISDVCTGILCVVSAAARDDHDGRFGVSDLDAEKGCDFCFIRRIGYMAGGKFRLSVAEFFREVGATRTAASSAVCACEFFEDCLGSFVRLDFAEFNDEKNESGQGNRNRRKDADDDSDLTPLNGNE